MNSHGLYAEMFYKAFFSTSGGKIIAQYVCNTENILTFVACNQHSFPAPYLHGTDWATED